MNPLNYNSSPDHLRGLITPLGVSNNSAARLLGVQPRMMRKYLINGPPNAPFSVVYLLTFYSLNPDIVALYSKILNDHYQKGLNNE